MKTTAMRMRASEEEVVCWCVRSKARGEPAPARILVMAAPGQQQTTSALNVASHPVDLDALEFGKDPLDGHRAL